MAAPVALATAAPVRLAAELVRAIHADSRGSYGWRRVNAELVYGHGVIVNPKTVRKIMGPRACRACQEPKELQAQGHHGHHR